MEKYNSIPTEEVEQDLLDTQNELDQYEKELNVLIGNRTENKVRIYMTEGKILQRKELIDLLKSILEYRKEYNG